MGHFCLPLTSLVLHRLGEAECEVGLVKFEVDGGAQVVVAAQVDRDVLEQDSCGLASFNYLLQSYSEVLRVAEFEYLVVRVEAVGVEITILDDVLETRSPLGGCFRVGSARSLSEDCRRVRD